MYPITNQTQLFTDLGISGIGQIGNAVNVFQAPVMDFAAIAAGSAFGYTFKNDSGKALVLDYMIGDVWASDATGGCIAGTPLLHDAGGKAADNTMPSRCLVSLNLVSGNNGLFRTRVPWTCIVGRAERPLLLAKKVVIAPGQECRLDGINGTSIPISGVLVPHGHYINIG